MFFNRKRIQSPKGREVDDIYLSEWKIAANAHADAYAARRKKTDKRVVLWVGREPLTNEQQSAFQEYVEGLKSSHVSKIDDYGIDSSGVGFVAVSTAALKRLDFDHADSAQIRRRFLASVLLVDRMHKRGIVCGNLSSDSFLLDSKARPQFVGFFGFPPGDSGAPAVSDEFITYRRRVDEQMSAVSEERDVYALSVIGLKLFGATFPPGYIEQASLPDCIQALSQDVPQWVDSVLLRNVEKPDPLPFRSCSELLAAIMISEDQSKDGSRVSRASGEGLEEISRGVFSEVISSDRDSRVRWAVVVGGCIAIAFIIVAAVVVMKDNPLQENQPAIASGAVDDLAVRDSLDEKFQQRLTRLGANDDPRVHLKFDEILRDTAADDVRRFVWLVIAERAARLGLRRTGAVLLEKIPQLRSDDLRGLTAISKAFDPYQGAPVRNALFESYLTEEPRLTCALVIAASLDREERNYFRVLLKSCLGLESKRVSLPSAHEVSSLALIAALDRERMRYGDDVRAQANDLSEADVVWLFDITAGKNAAATSMLAELALAKNMITWPRLVFMRVMQSTASSTDTPIDALIHSAMLGPSEADVAQYTAWYDDESIKALLAVLLEEGDPSVRSSAFDALDNKPFEDSLTKDLMALVKTRAVESRGMLANLVGAVAFRNEIEHAMLSKYLSNLQGAPIERDVFTFLLFQGDLKIIQAVLNVKGSTINPVSLVQLLRHPDSKVRSLVIPYLKGITVASSRRAVRDYYFQERDPEVRAVFEREIPGIGD